MLPMPQRWGAVDFRDGKIQAELPAGNSGMLMINV